MNNNDYIRGFQMEGPKYLIEQAKEMAVQFYTDAIVENGIVRWKSNGNVPPKDILEFWNFLKYDFDIDKTFQAYQDDTDKFFNDYRKNQKAPSQEELYEMRAAFGEGTTIVDVISGREIRL